MKFKILTIMLTTLLVLNCISPAIFATEETSKTYIYDNYSLEYNISNSWETNQNIETTSEVTI